MATYSGYEVTGLTVGAAYTAVVIVWREAGAPVVAATGDGVTFGPSVTVVNEWRESRVTFVATATAQVVGIARLDASVGRVYIDAVAIVPIPTADAPYAGAYFDGSTTDVAPRDYAWTGTANASTSTLTEIHGAEVFVTPSSGQSLSAPESIDILPVTDPRRATASFSSADYDGIDIGLGSVGTVTLSGLMVQILPTGITPEPGAFISGQGHSGCEFAAEPMQTSYQINAQSERVGMTARLVETGGWK